MATYLPLPNGAYYPVADGQDPKDAWQRAMQKYPEAFTPKPPEPPKPEAEGGFFPALKASYSALTSNAVGLAGRTGIMDLPEAEKYIADEKKYQAETFKPTTKSFAEDPLTNIKELLGGSLPYMVAPLAVGAAVGSAPVAGALGLAGAGATALGLGGAGLASLTQFTGSNLARQVDDGGKTLGETDIVDAALAAIPQAALDTISLRMIPGLGKILEGAGIKLGEQEIKNFAGEAIKKTAADYALKTGRTMGIEGLTEAGQQVFERAQAGLSITDPEARQEYFDSFIGGAVLGGVIAPAGRYIERGQAQTRYDMGEAVKQQTAQQEQLKLDALALAEEERKKSSPEYFQTLSTEYKAAEKAKNDLIAQKRKIVAGSETETADRLHNTEITAQLKEMMPRLTELGSEYNNLLKVQPKAGETVPEKEKVSLAVGDTLDNPLGNFTKDEVASRVPALAASIDKLRAKAGKPALDTYSIEDLRSALPAKAKQDQIDGLNSLIAARTGHTGDVVYSQDDIFEVAKQKNIDTTTEGFKDFLRRSTGDAEIAQMSQPQLHSAFTALSSLPKFEETQILPQKSNATDYSKEQYGKAVAGLQKLVEDRKLGGTEVVKEGEKPIAKPVSIAEANAVIKAQTGLKNDADVQTLLRDANRNGDIDFKGNEVTYQPKGAQAEFNIEEGAAPAEGTGFNVMRDGKPLFATNDEAEATAKADTLGKDAATAIKQIDKSIAKENSTVADSQKALNAMEAEGKFNTPQYTQAAARHAGVVDKANKTIESLNTKKQMLQKPVTVQKAGKPTNRKTFTVKEKGVEEKAFNTREEAEKHALENLPEQRLNELSTQTKAPGFANRLKKEQERRKKPVLALPAPAPKGPSAEATALHAKLLPMLRKFGLGDVALKIEEAMQNEGEYSASVIKVALDATNPLGVLRHEVIHGLKDLGFFTPGQWKILENKADKEWIDKYLRQRNVDGGPLKAGEQSRYDAYDKEYNGDADAIREEAISDAFRDFDVNGAPKGLFTQLLDAMRKFFRNLRSALNGAGYETAEDIFGKVERGELKATKAAEGEEAKASVRKLSAKDRNEVESPEDLQEKSRNRMLLESHAKSLAEYNKLTPQLQKKLDAYRFAERRAESTMTKSGNQMDRSQSQSAITRAWNAFNTAFKDNYGRGMTDEENFAHRSDFQRSIDEYLGKEVPTNKPSMRTTAKGLLNPNILTKYEKIINDVANEMELTPEEFASTSLIHQTGKAGVDQFESNKIGGLPEVVQFLQDQRRNSGLPLLDIEKPADRKMIAKLMATEAMAAIRSGGANLEWYDSIINKTLAMAGLKYSELNTDINARMAFRIATAITSQGLNVEDNLGFAMKVYDQFRQNNKFPEIGQGADQGAMVNNFKLANYLMNDMGANTLRQFLETEFTVEEMRGAGFNIAGELGDEVVLGSSVFGPKIGFGFYSNLNGNFDPVTMDMWFMRTIGRLTGKLKSFRQDLYDAQLGKFRDGLDIEGSNGVFANQFNQDEIDLAKADDKAAEALARKVKSAHERDYKVNRAGYDDGTREKSKLVAAAETMIKSLDAPKDAPANGSERRNLRDVVRQMVDIVEEKYGKRVPPASLQAVIWYPEQELYKAMGVKLRVTSQNYAGAIEKILKGEGYGESDLSAAAKLRPRTAQQLAKSTVASGTQATGTEPVRLGALQAGEKEALLERGRKRVVLTEEKETPKRKKLIFEVAPDPNNKALTAKWRALPNQSRINISEKIGNIIIKNALNTFGLKGYVDTQVGSYLDDTNPSFALYLDSGDAVAMTKFLGHALSQDSMMVLSPKPAKGLDKTGAVRINIGNMSSSGVDNIYQQLREIEVDGEKPVGGQSYMNGHMVVLNYSNVPTDQLASLINKKLDKSYEVITEDVYTAFPEKKDYDYADSSSDPRGNAGVLRQASRNLRTEATRLLQKELREFKPAAADKAAGGAKASLRTAPDTAEFKQWFGDSKIVDADGNPRVMYHGTAQDITAFKPKQAGAIFLTDDPTFAGRFSGDSLEWMSAHADQFLTPTQLKEGRARAIVAIRKDYGKRPQGTEMIDSLKSGDYIDATPEAKEYLRKAYKEMLPSGPSIMPVYIRAEKPFDYDNREHVQAVLDEIRANDEQTADYTYGRGNAPRRRFDYSSVATGRWEDIESAKVQDAIKSLGFDGFYVLETGRKNLAVYDPAQIKSATGNEGTYDINNPDIRKSLRSAANMFDQDELKKHAQTSYKSREKVVEMDIDDFLNLADYTNSVTDSNSRGKMANARERVANGTKFTTLPYLSINGYSGTLKVTGHEGRHRAKALQEVGYKTMPVLLHSDIRWSEQNDPEKFDYQEGWPERIEAQVDAINPNFSIPFPFTREESGMDYEQPTQARASLRTNVKNDLSTMPNGAAILATMNRVTPPRETKGFAERVIGALAPESWSYFRQQALDRYNRLSDYDKMVAKQMGGIDLLADQSAHWASLHSDNAAGIAASALGVGDRMGGTPVLKNGYVTVDNFNGTVKGVVEIISPLARHGDPDIYRLYQQWSAAKRGTRLYREGRFELLTPQEIKDALTLEQKYPEFVTVQQEWIKYNNGLVKLQVDAGVITKEAGAEFMKYSDYIPLYRQMDGENTLGPSIYQSISGVKAPKTYKGKGTGPIEDYLETIVRNTQAAIQASMKNVAAQKAVKNGMILGMVVKLPAVSSSPDTITILENGKKVSYQCADRLWVEAVSSLNLPELPFLSILAKPADMLRALVTKDPGFMLANMMRDSVSAYVTSGANIKPVISTVKNFGAAIMNRSPVYQALLNAGAIGGYEFSRDVEAGAEALASDLRKKTGTQSGAEKLFKPFTGVWNMLERGTEASDAATRMAVYEATLKETGNEAEAIRRAVEVLNFNRKGRSAVVRIAAAAIPFLNARVQGLDVFFRAGIRPFYDKNSTAYEKQVQKAMLIRGATIMALSTMYAAAVMGDPDYEKQEQETKDNFWLIPSLGIKIPIPFEVGTLFKTIPERIYRYSYGSDTTKDLGDSMKRALLSTFAFNPVPQAIAPLLEAQYNYSVFTQRPIVGEAMQNIAPEFQVGPSTTKIAEFLGKQTGMSPIMIDHVYKGYTGTMGMYLADVMDSVFSAGSDNPKASQRFEQTPVLKRFLLDPDAKGQVSAYYDLKNSVDQTVRTVNLLSKQGSPELEGFIEKNISMYGMKGYISSVDKQMQKLNAQAAMIRSTPMSASDKREMLDEITRLQNQLTNEVQFMRKMSRP